MLKPRSLQGTGAFAVTARINHDLRRDGRALTMIFAATRAQQFNSLEKAFNFIEENARSQKRCTRGWAPR
jgi:hypothetical protein